MSTAAWGGGEIGNEPDVTLEQHRGRNFSHWQTVLQDLLTTLANDACGLAGPEAKKPFSQASLRTNDYH